MIRAWAAFLPLTLLLASCGGGTPSTPSAGSNPQARTVSAKFTFTIPLPAARGSAHSRKPQYLPATTQSLEVTLLDVNGVPPSPTPTPTIANVAAPPCTITNGDYTCIVTVGLPVGSDMLLVQSFDAANAGGHLLSQQQSTFVVVQNIANAFTLTFDAVPGQIAVTPPAGTSCKGSPIANCTVATGGTAQSFAVTVADAHGTQLTNNTIPGSPVLSATSSNLAAATVTAAQDPYGITLTLVGAGTSTITVTATPASATSGLTATTFAFTLTVEAPSLNSPFGIGLDASGNIYVTNSGNGTVAKYAAGGGAPTLTISNGINTPEAVAVDATGKIYVANSTSNTVTTYTNAGAPTTPTISGLSGPGGVAVDAMGNIDVSNFSNNTVTQYTSAGAPTGFVLSIQVSNPFGVALDMNGNFYVVNHGDATLSEYASTGGMPTLNIGSQNGPVGDALDASGNIYIANSGNNTVNEYSPNGTLRLTITVGVNSPTGVAVDASGNIYVVNQPNNTVTEYAPTGGNPILTLY
jgi:sugar lactone lactonase YvrE